MIPYTLQQVLKKALAYDGLARGLHEAARAIEKGQAKLCVLAEDCNQPDYKKLIEALCAEHNVSLLSVPEAKQLGQWAGLCKIDAEGEARKVGAFPLCSTALHTESCLQMKLRVPHSVRIASSVYRSDCFAQSAPEVARWPSTDASRE